MAKPEHQKFLAGFKVKKFKKEIELQEILLDSLAQKKEKEIGIFEKRLETPLSRRILLGFWVSFLILLFVLFGKTFQLQVLEGKTLTARSAENEFIIHSIQSERGVIYDQNLKQLVFNKPSFDLICEGKVVAKDLDHQNLILWETKIEKFPECEIKNNTAREYLEGSALPHLLGYRRRTGEKTGLEKYYDEVLKARPGELQIKKDVYGNPISKEIVSLPESGHSLVLWLDSDLQKKIRETLEKGIKRVGAQRGAAVALNPKTGGVIALVSWPDFDNNLFSQGISESQWRELQDDPNDPFFNRAISGFGYPTGSTIKPLIGLAALEEGIINANTKIFCPLEICVQNPWYPEKEECYTDWKYHGTSDLKRAIAESVNTFFYQIGGGYQDFKGLGATKIKEWLKIFGWGSETGIDLPKEGKGILPDLEQDWRLGDTYHFSIGQGPFAVTPLQEATAYVAIANKGKLFQPQVVKEIIDDQKQVIKKIEPGLVKEIPASQEHLEVVRQGMRQAVTSPASPAYILNSLPVTAASKTGTAQIHKEKEIYHTWVTVFAPYQNPQIVLTLVIENVEGMQLSALPIAKEILEWYFSTSKGLDRNSD